MGWLIAVVVVALMIAPVMWMLPSKFQQRQARFRERARQLGLLVRVGNLPQTRRLAVRREDEQVGVSYTLPLRGRRGAARPHWVAWRTVAEGEARFSDDAPPALRATVEELWPRLPADVMALESDGLGYAAHWREQGDEEAVSRIADVLRELVSATGMESDNER